MKISTHKHGQRGQLLVVVIIIAVILLGGWFWLDNNRKTMDRECRAFGREIIERLTVQHDLAFFRDHLSPQMRLEYPPSQQDYVISRFRAMGVPLQPINIEENVTFENHFFSPRGYFTANLLYPAKPITMRVAISHPVGRWQLDDLEPKTGPSP
jgi:hypothetical protein